MIGEKLKYLRKKTNKTQTEIANFLNVSYVAYGDYERNKSLPDINTTKKLASYFNVSIDYLLDHKSNELKVSFTQEEVNDLIKIINMLNNKIK